MKYINESHINGLLDLARNAKVSDIDDILKKSMCLKRLSLEEVAVLLENNDPETTNRVFHAASYVKNQIYGPRIVLFAPLYISNICSNNCIYCAFKTDNKSVERRSLTMEEIAKETVWLLNRGHKRVLLVSGEEFSSGRNITDYYTEAIETVYSVSCGPHKIRRVNINCAPLSVAEFKKLKQAGIGTFQLFQETYHEETYRRVHPRGPKSDPDNRIDAVNRAFKAGIDDFGIGVLFGLYDWKFEILGLLSHIEALEDNFCVGPHTISVPRLEPAAGVDFSKDFKHLVSDDEFKRIVAILRLAVPYTGMILSTRETAKMRDELFNLGISQASAESNTSPGGYASSQKSCAEAQFELSDIRTLDEVVSSLIEKGLIPSFCAACYRKARTGEVFMNLAKPGTIKGKCQLNALITFKEYLDDFASPEVRQKGYKLIDEAKKELNSNDRSQLDAFYSHMASGARDEYV